MTIPIINAGDHADRPLEQLDPDAAVQWIDGGRILVSRFRTSRQASYDRWESWLHQVLADWPIERTLCILYDLRSPQFGMTLYIGTRIRQLNATYPHLHGPSAIVYTSKSLSPALVTVLRLMRPAESRARDYFMDFDAAVRWLQTQFRVDESIAGVLKTG